MSRATRLWRRIRATRGLGKDLAVVVAMILLGSAVLAWILANQKFVWAWEKRVSYQADFVETPSIAPGKNPDVRIAGVRVGEVRKAEVTPEGRARLTLALEPRYAQVYDDARVLLRPNSPLNDMYVLLEPGGPPAERLRPGSVIPATQTARPVQADEVLAHLDERARKAIGIVITELDTALSRPQTVGPALRAGKDTLTSLRPLAEALDTRRQGLARLVTALSDIATAAGGDDRRLARLLADARSAVDALSTRDAELDATLARLPGVADDIRAASGSLQALTGELDPTLDGLRKASDVLPPALAGARGLLDRLDGTVQRVAPVLAAVKPVISDLRPLVADLRGTLEDTAAWSPRLDPITANLVRYIPVVRQAVYQTNSVLSLEDPQGAFGRPWPVARPESIPAAPPAASAHPRTEASP